MYGHPDHIAISQLTTTAVMAAADPSYKGLTSDASHRVAKLYYRAFVEAEQTAYEATFGHLVMPVDSVERRFTVWPEWAITTRIDTAAYKEQVWKAIICHQSQLPDEQFADVQNLRALPTAYQNHLWGGQSYYRAMSLVNGGREMEDDFFDGLRDYPEIQRPLPVIRQPVTA